MELARRFIFHGSASTCGGRIYRPRDVIITTGAASSLMTVGGLSRAQAKPQQFGPYIEVGPGETSARGVVDDRKLAVACSLGKVREDALSMTTTVSAKIENVRVLGDRLRVTLLSASLESASPVEDREPTMRLGTGLAVKGVEIDGFALTVTLNRDVFRGLDTYTSLTKASRDPAFVEANGTSLGMYVAADGVPAPPPARLVAAGGTIYTTIVKELRWTKRPHPDARIDGHSVIVPEFGRIFFGELLVATYSRRLSMMRLKLGSPVGGDAEFAGVETNGSWFPPAM